jgi:TonB family protein
MNRIQKKCFVASTGVHLLLVVILFVGSAFFSPPKKAEDLQEVDILPTKLIDAMMSGGGERVRGTPQPPSPPPRAAEPSPTPEKAKEPDPPKEQVKQQKPPKPDVESFEPTKKQPKLSPEALKMVSRKQTSNKTQKKTSSSNNTSDGRDEQLAKLSQEIARAARGIKDGTAAPTQIVDIGPGGGGPSYANYKSWIYTRYLNAWVPPDDAAQEFGVVEAEVTIARDGTVISSKIISRSGDPQLDGSVQRTLSRVTTIGKPFPDGVKENERTYNLRFDIKTKRGLA